MVFGYSTNAFVKFPLIDAVARIARLGFKGVEIIARNGRPAEARHSLQIEIKRSCYADVERHAPNAGFERLQRALQAMLAALATHVRAECGMRRA